MMNTLKTENWEQIIPFKFYLDPLLKKINDVRKTLLTMHKLGHLRIKYIIEDNEEFQNQVRAMIKHDNIVQWLMHD